MKEQWKKLDSDAKLFVDVEEGNELPIKINIPLSALTPVKDEFCCNRLLTVLRVFVLLTLLTLLGWTATTLYNNYYYYDNPILIDEANLDNRFAFQHLVYKNKDGFETSDKFKNSDPEDEVFRDSTKKALDQISAQIKSFNERLDQLQIKKELQQDDAKSMIDEVVTSERSDQTLDSMLDELAKEVGLDVHQPTDQVHEDYLPLVNSFVVTEPVDDGTEELKKMFERTGVELNRLLEKLNNESNIAVKIPINLEDSQEESGYEKLFGEFSHPTVWQSSEESQAKNEFSEMLDRLAAELVDNVDVSQDADKQLDQAVDAMINEMLTSYLDNDNEQKEEKQDKTVGEEQETEEGFMDELVNGFIDTFFADETTTEDDVSENTEASQSEDKIGQLEDDYQEETLKQIIGESLLDIVEREILEDEEKMDEIKSTEDSSEGPSILGELINFIVNDEENNDDVSEVTSEEKHEDDLYSIFGITMFDDEQSTESDEKNEKDTPVATSDEKYDDFPFQELFGITVLDDKDVTKHDDEIKEESPAATSEEKYDDIPTFVDYEHPIVPEIVEASVQETSTPKKSSIDMVPSVEYVKKIEENPFIPRVAKMLEPIVGQNHELLIWYYTHKDLPEFLRGSDKWKVFGAKLLYDPNIKDYPADATIVSGLTFEKVYGGAEYPSSNEEIKSELQQEIVDRLILKSYLNKMLLEGNAEAEALSQVIEQHNLQKLQELDIDPKQLTYVGDFFEVDNRESDDLKIPVVQFDPFVDESREANEQRAQVIKAFEKTRNLDDVILKPSYEKYSNGFTDSTLDEQVNTSEPSAIVEDSKQSSESVMTETSYDWPEEPIVYGRNYDSLEYSDNWKIPAIGEWQNGQTSHTTDAIDWLTEFLPEQDEPI